MAWAEKYRVEFKDTFGVEWVTKIHEDAYSGGVYTLKATGNPLIFEIDNDSDEVFDPIKKTFAIINVYSETNFALTDLYSTDEMQFYVEIYADNVLKFKGYIDTQNYEEPYEDVPYPVAIKCTDGLSLLSNMLYKYQTTNPDDTYYNGRRLESQVILDVLGKIGFTTFAEYVNIYENSMNTGVADSPMSQLKIDVDVFRDEDTAMYCDEVLTHVLEKYCACIIQRNGLFCIYRPKELTGTTVYGRIFSDANTSTATSYDPDQNINRSTSVTKLQQVPGGVLMIQSPAKKVTVNQDYGNKESWIDNWQFKASTHDGTDFESWSSAGGDYNKPIGDYVAGENNGIAIIDQDVIPPSYVAQTFGGFTKTSATDLFVIDFDYATFNVTAVAINPATIGITISQTKNLHEVDDTYVEWSAVVGETLAFDVNAPVGWSGWMNYKRQIAGIEDEASIGITLYGDLNSPGDVYICFRNIRFYCTSTETLEKTVKRKLRQRITGGYGGEWQLKDKYYTVKYLEPVDNITEYAYEETNSINGKELDYNFILGDVIKTTDPGVNLDNIIEQFRGSLATGIYTLAGVAAKFVTDHASDYSAGGGGGGTTATLTSRGNVLVFTADDLNTDFDGATSISNTSGNLSGTVATVQAAGPGVARIDEVTLTGTAGAADVTCNAVTEEAAFVESEYTTAWNTRGGSENKPLLHIIAEEIAYQYRRPKQFIDLPIQELVGWADLNVIGNVQDDLNTVPLLLGSVNRKFTISRGTWDVKNRRWKVDLIEVIRYT